MSEAVRIHRTVLDQLLAEARSVPDLECCGLLAGRDGAISAMLPAKNAAGSANAYEIAPAELFSLFRRMRAECLEHLGIYHSHPHGDNVPSPSDVALAFYPAAAYFIVSPRAEAMPPIRAFRIGDSRWRELTVHAI